MTAPMMLTPGLRQEHVAHDLPGGAADAVGALAQHRRDLVENVACDRGDEGDDHDREDDAGRQDADAGGHARIEDGADDGHALDECSRPGSARKLAKSGAKTKRPHMP